VWRSLALWTLVLAGVTLLLGFFRDALDEAHKTLAYLLIVLGASALHGRVVGLVLALLSFFVFNFFLVPPYHTLAVADPLDWGVLLAFLLTGAVAAQLLHRAQHALALAEARAGDIERLSGLAAESLSAPSAADAVQALAGVIRSELSVGWVEIVSFDQGPGEPRVIARSPEQGDAIDPRLASLSAREGRVVTRAAGEASHATPPGTSLANVLEGAPVYGVVIVPLRIRDRTIGTLGIADADGLRFDRARAAFAAALIHYAALAVERVRLAAEVEHVGALEEADRLKDALLASVSHDLRTPLTTIRALASEMRSTSDDRSVIIEEEAERLNRLVADLLDFSRVRAGGLPLDLQLVAAEDLVGAALQRLAGLPGSERIEVALPQDGSLPVARMDFVQALRALGNLLENALKHGGGQVVRLEVSVEDADLVVRVLDRGSGVAPSDREHIFEPFFQSSTAAPKGWGGTGLGLAIARSVVEAQSGSVRYRPRAGGGSVFEMRLPAASIEAA
jgi:two-component system sensor histidine kinase KdpD